MKNNLITILGAYALIAGLCVFTASALSTYLPEPKVQEVRTFEFLDKVQFKVPEFYKKVCSGTGENHRPLPRSTNLYNRYSLGRVRLSRTLAYT
jgi:hypothetical protein